jgi:hypothetical protein
MVNKEVRIIVLYFCLDNIVLQLYYGGTSHCPIAQQYLEVIPMTSRTPKI